MNLQPADIKTAPPFPDSFPDEPPPVNNKSLQGKKLAAYNIHDFLGMVIPQQEEILSPIIRKQTLAMLYAKRGVGKTHVALGIAYAVAAGCSFLKWKAAKARRVLLVDGEMPARTQQERLAALVDSNEAEIANPEFLKIITPDMQELGIPDLATQEGQQAIEQHLEGVELLILDNLSTLCRTGKENESESWLPMQQWVLSLRKRGIAVLFIHHAGKNDQQRGNSKKEDIMTTIISLQRPSDYVSSEGARFEVHYQKAREFYGEEAEPFEASLVMDNGKAMWTTKDLKDGKYEQIIELRKLNLSYSEISTEVGLSKSQVARLADKAKQEGRLS